MLDQELIFAPHIHRLYRDSFYQLRQLRTVVRLPQMSHATLIHAFITARLDYCSSLYAGLPVGRLRCLDRVLDTAACRSRGIPKFGHVSNYMLDVLHWLPLQQRISYRIISLVWRSFLGLARLILDTSAVLPWEFQVVAFSALLSGVFLSSLLLTHTCYYTKQNRAFSVLGED